QLEVLIPETASRAVVLYAPTWRDGALDPAIPSADEATALRAVLAEAGAVLLIRSHPLGAGDYGALLGTHVRMLGSDVVADVTPLLPAVDALVTDYSSLAFDAALVPVPTLFLAPDLADYARTRGFYGTYADVAGSDAAGDWTVLTAQLGSVLSDHEERERRVGAARALSARLHAFDDGENTARVYRAIQARLAAERRS
ncbi:CDP-glycerol glycerophosphotransferase family protein, partial [Microbacterium sp.]|uniref:CDP-glycerol glycerophosphotransferase family protein n=1 Tax=Microbacterium sp. TaxID=51671 RepID=UPI003C713338